LPLCCEGEISGLLRARGRRVTPQRLLVAEIVRHGGGHLTTSQVLEQVRQSSPFSEISTVYRTLALLHELRLISETHGATGEFAYEWAEGAPHHHLLCRACGHSKQIDAAAIAPLLDRLQQSYNFRAEPLHLAIEGLCGYCAEHGAGESVGADAG
jgi:Fur family transcriptional regulator, ferric uptake regulator